ncbi:MAG TPA: hypothetical protein VHB21_04225, partial [Minicystis sp.]|nr:hypothetical protein [Minicystis sp.]
MPESCSSASKALEALATGARIGYFPAVRSRAKDVVRAAASLALVSLGAGVLAGCPPETILPQSVIVPTGIQVDPAAFLGGVPCTPAAGGMRSYVATLIDVADVDNPFTLPSSPPTPCSEAADFRYVVNAHPYVAIIDGYTASASSLEPLGGKESGSRHMVTASDQVVVTPRWAGQCGAGPGAQ